MTAGAPFEIWIDDFFAVQAKGHARREDVVFRAEVRPSLSATQVEAGVRKYANLTQREVAARLGLTTGSGISYQIRKIHRQMETRAVVGQLVANTIKALETISGKR